jgi:hypothetical protein
VMIEIGKEERTILLNYFMLLRRGVLEEDD